MKIAENIVINNFNIKIAHTPLAIKKFKLDETTTTSWSTPKNTYIIEAKKGFTWDGATIPRPLWSIIGYYPTGIMLAASLWHDLIYIQKGNIYNMHTNEYKFISRKHCDQLFYAHMLQSGVKEKAARTMYQTIRLFGRFYWSDFSDFNPFKKK
jgi:hypothetical protein